MSDTKARFQIVWGLLLLMAGIGVFIRVPQVMPTIETIETFSGLGLYIRFCFYLIGVMLIGGGAKKIYINYRALSADKRRTDPKAANDG